MTTFPSMRELMILSELHGYRNADTDDLVSTFADHTRNHEAMAAVARLLVKKGYKVVHTGGFSVVVTKPDLGYVIKLFRNDEAYLRFVEACLHSSNPHLPRFRGGIVAIARDSNIFAVRMELLTPCPRAMEKVVEVLRNFSVSPQTPEEFLDDYRYYGGDREVVTILETQSKILPTIEALKSLETTDIAFDIKLDNVMMRGSTIVFTDPLYSHKSWMAGVS